MELSWKEINAERLVQRQRTQVKVSGELPSPDGRIPETILGRGAKVVVETASVENDTVRLKGSVIANVIAEDANGETISYESKAAFDHSLKIDGACPGMTAQASAAIQSFSIRPSESGAFMDADVDLDVLISTAVPMKVTGGINGIDDLEINSMPVSLRRRSKLGHDRLRMREELAADGVSSVLSSEGQITVRDVSVDQGSVSISGVITVSAVTVDKNGHLSQLIRQIPFRERVNMDSDADEVYCEASLMSLYLNALGEDFALISMDADVSFELYGLSPCGFEIPVDAYSPTVGFDCLCEEMLILESHGIGTSQTTIKETVPLPEDAAELASPLFASAVPVITSVDFTGAGMTVSGVLLTSVTYESTAGKKYTFSEDVPFETSTDSGFTANMPMIAPSAVCSVTGTGDRSVQLTYNLVLDTEYLNTIKSSAVVGLAEKELPARMSGIVICFASEGETEYDVAKRYSVPRADIRRLNPDAVSPFKEGEKLILMV
ncbi:MAG: DUF3794 domain-containing protein [Clostridiales bacterium]|nr:DUF3794 domain-containing protein [Clostridiales bacterium]